MPVMAEIDPAFSLEVLPAHLVADILCTGRLAAADLARVGATCRLFWSVAECAACRLCEESKVFDSLPTDAKEDLLTRCGNRWKKVLQFLESVVQSSAMVETSAGNMQVATGRYHSLLIHKSSLYSCGSSLCGVLGHGQEITQCLAFRSIKFPSLSRVVNVSASQNHTAFVTENGEVFTFGDNSSFCCGHGDMGRTIFHPTKVEELKGIPCKQVTTGLSFTAILTIEGQVYTCGNNIHGQLGHGDTLDRPRPVPIELFKGLGQVVQVAAGTSYTLAVTDDGTLHSFGSCTNFCLGHEDQHNELLPRAIQSFRSRNVRILRVSAGDEHAVAFDSLGYVYTWGRGYCGALGHGDESDKTLPELLTSLKGHVAVQVCARKRKTFVLTVEGTVYAFGWACFGSLGLSDIGSSDKVTKPMTLNRLQGHCISQLSTGLYHTIAITKKGLLFGFGDNEKAQLGHGCLEKGLKPTEIKIQTCIFDDLSVAGSCSSS